MPNSSSPGQPTSLGHGKGGVTRRQFLFQMAAAGTAVSALGPLAAARAQGIRPVRVDNPLTEYPNRDWEQVYRDLFRSDSTFTFLCAPNDTHNCLLHAHVKHGVVTRISPTFGFHKATDLEGNQPTQRWEPRCCQKGLAMVRRFYGDRRCRKPMIRRGFKRWIDDGCPRDPDTGAVDAEKYLRRGQDPFLAVSWEEIFEYSAKGLVNIARTYSGEQGRQYLRRQGYDPLMAEATEGAGTQTIKFRGGMPALGVGRIFAMYRAANAMALLDDKLRGTEEGGAIGARGWDNYSWHTDLPPGHPMVTGQQTVDFDLCNVEHSNLVLVWGMNWITTKMPDSHFLSEARMKGTHVVVIACEYSATTNKADEAFIVRPGTTPALALGLAQVLIGEQLYDESYILAHTDLPLLVRNDTGELLRAADVFADHQPADLEHGVMVIDDDEAPPPPHQQSGAVLTRGRRSQWGDFVLYDRQQDAPVAVNRDQIGQRFRDTGIAPQLEGEIDIELADGGTVTCRSVFDVTKQMLDDSYTPEQVEKLTWAPADAIRKLARRIADNPEKTLFAMGMGPNQFFNNDLKDRAVFLVAALTRNIGHVGGNVGSYAGNYRGAYFSGVTQYINENPFDIEPDPESPARPQRYWRAESVHYFNHGDKILRSGDAVITGRSHIPTPTKAALVSNSNSLIGNAKAHYDTIVNVLPKVEFVSVAEWWWTASCEYADVVFPVDSWAEMKQPDLTMSVTNPFLYVFPATPLPRIHDTRGDMDVVAGICRAIGRETDDPRHEDYWRFIDEEHAGRPYLQRILDHSNSTRGYQLEQLEENAAKGIPALMQTRTYPKIGGWEQANEDRPWYTRSGRLEFYRDEPEFMDAGENIVLHREPIDSTFYEPNVIVARPHPLLRPKNPADYGVDPADLSADAREARHVVRTLEELLDTSHPLKKYGYQFIFHTPKYRHGAHTTPIDLDIIALWFGPFGDMHRRDKRSPGVSEMYVDIHPLDAREVGVEDGDYVWIDADPEDRPFRGWQRKRDWHRVARLLARARYYPGTPRGVTRMWHNAYGATWGSVMAAVRDPEGLAKTKQTGYQSLFRSGSQQSCTRSYLKPTQMTDTLQVKDVLSQVMTQGFVPDVHCPTGAPREAMVRITRAEAGGIGGRGLWRPAELGLRPTYETENFKRYLAGELAGRP